MSNVREHIVRLTALRVNLTNPEAFYALHLDEWRTWARQIARDLLINQRPEETPPEIWEQEIAHKVAQIQARLMDGIPGAIISLSPFAEPALGSRAVQVGDITISDIEQWVAAGRTKANEDDPGKNIREIDETKSDLQIAWRVAYAIRLQKGKWAELRQHIEEFIGGQAQARAGSNDMLQQILKAWIELLVPVVIRQWKRWVGEQVARANR